MKQRISPFQFDDHREFIRQALKNAGYSYRGFTAKHGDVIAFVTLAMALTKGRSGTKNKPMRNFSPEMLARVGKALKLTEDEIGHLILLKFENDAETVQGPYGGAYSDSIRKLVRENKSRQIQSANKQGTTKTHYSQTGQAVAQLLDKVPNQFRSRIVKELVNESKVIVARQRNKAGVKAITSLIEKLENLLGLGVP